MSEQLQQIELVEGTTTTYSERVVEKLASRKFIVSLVTILLSTALLYSGSINMDYYYKIVIFVVGVYVSGNVIQKFVTK